MQLLTDIWTNLIRRQPGDPDRARRADVEQREERDEEIETSFRNLYWTGLISLQDIAEERHERRSLAPDIIESLNTLLEMEQSVDQRLDVLFDPAEFSQTNPAPIRREYQLDDEALREWAIRGTAIRKKFREKAEAYGRNMRVESQYVRSREGL